VTLDEQIDAIVREVEGLDRPATLVLTYEAHGWAAEVARVRDPQERVRAWASSLEQALDQLAKDLRAGRWGRLG
jgi:hypothetical protein